MIPLAKMPKDHRKDIQIVLSDIDDTLTTDGVFPAKSYTALEALCATGMTVVLITGRPAGWCDMIARFFPVDAVVGENGALCFYRDGVHVRQIWHDTVETRTGNLAQLHEIARGIIADFPGTALAQDNPWRASDVAVDFAEDVVPLSLETAEAIRARFEAEGATAKVSSIHVNAWFGNYDKLSMFLRWLDTVRHQDVSDIIDQAVYVGDSPNDVPMFKRFPHSVGVKNIMHYDLRADECPCFITSGVSANGFIELAEMLMDARK